MGRHNGLRINAMSIATTNGSLIVKDGKLAENCGCCDYCVQKSFYVDLGITGPRPLSACYNDNAQFGVTTVTVPAFVQAPVTVRITGYADDDIAINGKTPGNRTCRRDGAVDYTFCLEQNSFELAAVDNYGWIVSYDVKVCFRWACSSQNPLP